MPPGDAKGFPQADVALPPDVEFEVRLKCFLQFTVLQVEICALKLLCTTRVSRIDHARDPHTQDVRAVTYPTWPKERSIQFLTLTGRETKVGARRLQYDPSVAAERTSCYSADCSSGRCSVCYLSMTLAFFYHELHSSFTPRLRPRVLPVFVYMGESFMDNLVSGECIPQA